MTDTKANIYNMLSLLFNRLNPVFSHISLHKKTPFAIMFLSPSTFLSSSPNSLPKEKGTSNASLCPQSSALTDLTIDVSGLDHRGGKIGFADTVSLAFWDNKRQRYIRDGMERFLPAIFGLPNAINKTEQRGGCWFCGGWAWCTAGLLKGNRGKKLIEL